MQHQFQAEAVAQFSDHIERRIAFREFDIADGTRAKLLQGLAEKGFGPDQLAEMQKIIDAEKSDLFDVLAHAHFNSKQQLFLDFVLSHYVAEGVSELDQEKLTPLLRLKYHNSISDAVDDLGRPEEIGKAFTGFRKYLYAEAG